MDVAVIISIAGVVVSAAGVVIGLAALFSNNAKKTRVGVGVSGLIVLVLGISVVVYAMVRQTGTIKTEVGPVGTCHPFNGTADLRDGNTLVLTHKNLDNDDPHRHVQYVAGWDSAGRLSRWSAVQYFGSSDSSIGQRYQVELFAVSLEDAGKYRQKLDPDGGGLTGEEADDLVRGLDPLDAVYVHRVAGAGVGC